VPLRKKMLIFAGKRCENSQELRPGSPVHIKHAPETIVFGEDGRLILGGTDWRPWSWDARGFHRVVLLHC
jgi:hypothetical protein